ncbi:MAG: histidinol-phosphatase, partial [Pseudonocardiaceae bacterium]|nr:histidinol-phosphatase [Pseudonocardiaceae bacterium]
MPDWQDDLRVALDLADRADRLTLDRFASTDLRVDRKPDRTPVTDADLRVEDEVRARLADLRPSDTVVGEERGGGASGGRDWLLDYLRRLPVWATLIALVAESRPVVGVVSAPALDRRWWASAGGGAWTSDSNGQVRRLRVSVVGSLADAYLSTTHLGSWS